MLIEKVNIHPVSRLLAAAYATVHYAFTSSLFWQIRKLRVRVAMSLDHQRTFAPKSCSLLAASHRLCGPHFSCDDINMYLSLHCDFVIGIETWEDKGFRVMVKRMNTQCPWWSCLGTLYWKWYNPVLGCCSIHFTLFSNILGFYPSNTCSIPCLWQWKCPNGNVPDDRKCFLGTESPLVGAYPEAL